MGGGAGSEFVIRGGGPFGLSAQGLHAVQLLHPLIYFSLHLLHFFRQGEGFVAGGYVEQAFGLSAQVGDLRYPPGAFQWSAG